ncbi:AAA family ATPase [Methylobacterium iners]|uniref:DNA replication and repair protein RecF n=1 Tax=Methylobacterium iners TaxID=418707 RepID=A0ABQ4RVB9_9HYPH|nr:AAA family ATPase [Methylobacterium iners]GJD94778.1 DNA replication and repair protein RecF [Methylobacterium iners]
MKLKSARVQNYRSIRDTGEFSVEDGKTILVGPNEAGKTAILQALQKLEKPEGVKGFDPLRDYPRALYSDIIKGDLDPKEIPVVTAVFTLDEDDKEALPPAFRACEYKLTRYLGNNGVHALLNAPVSPSYAELENDLLRLASHADVQAQAAGKPIPSAALAVLSKGINSRNYLASEVAEALKDWLRQVLPFVDEDNARETQRLEALKAKVELADGRHAALKVLGGRVPIFVLFSNYFRVRPIIHLAHLAQRLETNMLDDDEYDYGNSCLLSLLGFTAKDLSELGQAVEPAHNEPAKLKTYRDQLDQRRYQLNAASVRLTDEIRAIWNPNPDRVEADRLKVQADGQYLKVVVEDDLGVEIELDQRSEGFQWLVSFFVVFFAEAAGKHSNAILLLDEPGMSLHALKQRDFRGTISRLAEKNQTLYTTHSPFLVGPDELDLVRVVQMTDRNEGTKVHTSVTSGDPAALLPLQEALGYDLAHSLFANQRNLVLEGLTDYWYVEAVGALMTASGDAKLNEKIALVPAGSAGKVVYFATILNAHKLKVAALLDSDTAGDRAANQDTLVHILGQKAILRTKDYCGGSIAKAEIEDLLRDTLVRVAKDQLGWDVEAKAAAQPGRPILDLFTAEIRDFKKYKLAKAFLRWAREHEADDLSVDERTRWKALIFAINAALK